MFEFLASQPLLLVSLLVLLGSAIGMITIKGINLGPAAVLFAALGLTSIGLQAGVALEVFEEFLPGSLDDVVATDAQHDESQGDDEEHAARGVEERQGRTDRLLAAVGAGAAEKREARPRQGWRRGWPWRRP